MKVQVDISKSALRKGILQYRRLLAGQAYEQRNYQLLERLKAWLTEEQPGVIHLFLPMARNREPDLTSLIDWLDKRDIRTLTSKTNFEARTLTHFEINEKSVFENNHLGIPEPTHSKQSDLTHLDLLFIPLLAADKMGNRIGYGGGFYDRLLKETNARRIGLCLSPLLDEILQRDSWDEPLDIIITPTEIWQKQH